jgi:hypothetical protein
LIRYPIGKKTQDYSIPYTQFPNNQDYWIQTIGDGAFAGCINLVSITIPKNVLTVGVSAFSGCSTLTSITISDTLETISNNAFFMCTKLETISILDNGSSNITSVGDNAFEGCAKLTSIAILKIVEAIGNKAFLNCTNLVSVDIEEGNFIRNIGVGAFKNCTALASINIPKYITHIPDQIFESCENLKSIKIPKTVTRIDTEAFKNCKTLDKIQFAEDENESQLAEIRDSAFSGCEALTSFTIPKNVANIFDNAFENCTNLESIVMPDNIRQINQTVFLGCNKLETITISEIGYINIMYISSDFFRMSKIKNLNIPEYIIISEDSGADGNYTSREAIAIIGNELPTDTTDTADTNVATIVMPASLIKTSGFKYAPFQSINVPGTVEIIGFEAFSNCSTSFTACLVLDVIELLSRLRGTCSNSLNIDYSSCSGLFIKSSLSPLASRI